MVEIALGGLAEQCRRRVRSVKGQKEQKEQKGNGKFKILLLLKLLKFPKLSGNKKDTRERRVSTKEGWVTKTLPAN